MGYLNNLYETYENALENDVSTGDMKDQLVPVGCATQNAQITVTIDEDGEFISATEVPKAEAVTMIPSTIRSAARTSKPTPHPLFDNLWYVAGDLEQYYEPKSKRQAPFEKNYVPYMEQLKEWLEASQEPYLKSIYHYLEKKTLTKDLIEAGILKLEEGKLTEDKIEGIVQHKAFVRFAVNKDGTRHELWNDLDFMNRYGEYYANQLNQEEKSLCYISGKDLYITNIHGKYIRNPGDGAKLISSNDKQFFTYRGRFDDSNESAQISYEVSEKAHAALRWLIQRQGYSRNGLVILAWTNGNQEIPQPTENSQEVFNIFDMVEKEKSQDEKVLETGQDFARRLNKAVAGYKADLNHQDRVNIISLDAATPGRISVLYYQELNIEDYLERIKYWHETAAWSQQIKVAEKKWVRMVCATSPLELIRYTFGTERGEFMDLHEKITNFQMKRILPCITEKKRIPVDVVANLTRNASRPMALNDFNWQKTFDIACGMVRKFNIERNGVDYGMALNHEERDRSYLYGRLLATVHKIETDYNRQKNIDRTTNAKRYMEAFSKRPYRTYKQIYERIIPYLSGLPKRWRVGYEIQIGEIMDLFQEGDFESHRGLDGKYLLGFSHQLSDMYKKRDTEEVTEEEENA